MSRPGRERLRLEVPFLAEDRYVAFLAERADRLHSLHFQLPGSLALDARLACQGEEEGRLVAGLSAVVGPRKYALLNSRFLAPGRYFDRAGLGALAGQLGRLRAAGQLDGLVFADYYLLRALADTAPELCGEFEAVPSVNCRIDSFAAVAAWCEAATAAGFRPPAKIVVDRDLNRALPRLAEIAGRCRERFPALTLALLANEGCLYRCPFKLAHDAHIALANTGLAPEASGALNTALGCRRLLAERPERLFRSPFIRPEDLGRYEGLVGVIKLCGRTLGAEFLLRTVAAYLDGGFAGNLLALTDTMEWLAGELHVANERLPADFLEHLAGCDGDCRACGYCHDLLDRCARAPVLRLKDWRREGMLRRSL